MCSRCWKINPYDDFMTEIKEINGVCCSKCRYQIFDYNDSVANRYIELKKEIGSCIDCGLDDIRFLEFDHLDQGAKICCLSESRSIKQLEDEYPKCVSRCGICHFKRTSEQLNYNQATSNKAKTYVDNCKKKIGGCQECKWYDPKFLGALQFDHIKPSQKQFNISYLVNNNANIEIIKSELKKCQLLCIHCHKLKTIIDNKYYLYIQDELGITRKDIREHLIKNGSLNILNDKLNNH